MATVAKLPVVSWREVIKLLEKHGFELQRTKGSHMSFRRLGFPKVVSVPRHSPLKSGTLLSILRTAGLTRGDLDESLEE